jgi:PEP-CTERM motif
MEKIFARLGVYVLVVAFLTPTQASAEPIVLIAPTSLGNGLFEYDLTVENVGGMQPIQGLILFNATSTFGLNFFSTINAPAGWSDIPPITPPPSDIVTFFSTDASTDVPIGGSLGGFSFDCSIDPSTLTSSDFVLNSVGSVTSTEQPITAQLMVPEPSTIFLLGSSLLIGFGYACRCFRFR